MTLFRRRTLDLTSRGETGQVALLDFGNPERPADIVFSHANGFNAFTYRHILEPLAADFRIIAYDLRGHGHTTLPARPEDRPDWTDLRDDLLALLERLELTRPVVLAGQSFGGTVSLMAAERAPEKARSLVVFDPVLFPRRPDERAADSPLVAGALRRRTVFDSRQAAIDSWRGRGAFATWPEELLVDYAADGLIDQPDGTVRLACAGAWEASSYMAQGQDGVAILLAARHPVLAYRAERHSTCTVAPDDPRLATNPLVRVVEVEGTSHFLPMERPDLVRASLTQAAKA